MKNVDCKEQSLSEGLYKSLKKNYQKDTKNVIVRHALSKHNINTIVFDDKNNIDVPYIFSKEVKTLPVCNQKASGRCWIFAGLNVLREIIASKLNLKDFELSQNYIALYDKLEKSNYLLTCIIDLIDEKPNERVLMHLLCNGVSDGGQWDMFRNLVKKYGLVPKNAFNETFQSSNTSESNFIINSYIRNFAAEASKLHKDGKDKEILLLKEKYMSNIYNLLVNCFGVVPSKFDFEYYDKDDKYHIEKDLTPKSFFDKYIGNEIEEYVSLINSPTEDKPFNKVFTISYLNNVVEGEPIKHLNVTMDRMKELIKAQIDDNSIVWFGSDVSFYRADRTSGIWDDLSYDYRSAFNVDLKFNKADMLDFHASVMNHAMCLTGYNQKEGQEINRWKVENSWGSEPGNKGYYIMSSSWFDSFVYQAVIKKKYLNEIELAAYNEKPIELDPWDPMGTLAD